MAALRPRPFLAAVLTAGALSFSTGCGDGDEGTSATADTTPTTTTAAEPTATAVPAVQNPLDSANAQSKTKAKKNDPARLGERKGDPALPASKGNELEAAKPGETLALDSSGDDGTWRVSATLDGQAFCVKASTPGPADPTPVCADPTTAGLTLSTSDGGAQVSVSEIRETARGRPTKLLVWGAVQRAVPSIKVVYAQQTKTARLSKGSVVLKIDPATVKALGDGADLDPTLNVRTFAVSFNLEAGNPPTGAIAKPSTPDGKPVTLTLQ